MNNIPMIKLGLISVSRNCFPIELSETRRHAVAAACGSACVEIYDCPVTVENEKDAKKAVEDVLAAGVNALVVYLGNFGPETPETMLAQLFGGPVMYCAAAEDDGNKLVDGRGDAYCGMLNCSYNLGLRGIRAYIPEYPVGTAAEVAEMIREFTPIAAALVGLSKLKVITFGPRPSDFNACNAPIQPLYDLGIEYEENSELDLLAAFNSHRDDPRIPAVMADMAAELGNGNKMSGILPRLAQYELTLLDWVEEHKGAREYVVIAGKCWPAFQTEFGFVPCYVNSRLTAKGIPVSCEVDVYGAVSEYIGTCVTGAPVTLLDINNSVPANLYEEDIRGRFDFRLNETFMGFHCGNTPICRLNNGEMRYQLIMKRSLEPDSEPNITRGTLEGDIAAGEITFFRLQGNARGQLKAYAAEGEVLPVATRSFGGIGIFAIPEMNRFYRHVLIQKQFPHHGAVAFGHVGKALFEIFKLLGVDDIGYNQPQALPYPTENPFVK
ncbi:MAG: L-fucose/L-arabinose isomerase family protein [Candidatus Merdivicinus sp.]|jgi:L-fucose isomerase-like protein